MSNQQLTLEITQALQQNDLQTLKLLLLDQQQPTLSSIKQSLPLDLVDKFVNFLQKLESEKQQNRQKKQNADRIRYINAQVHQGDASSDDEANLVQREIKKKKGVILESRFGYDFYGNVRCLMRAYGDRLPCQESVKMMHSQIQVLFEEFTKFATKLPKPPKTSQQQFVNKLICQIFKEEWQSFEQITKQYKKATKSTSTKQQELEEQESEQQCSSSSMEGEGGEAGEGREGNGKAQKWNGRHMSANTIQENQYLAMLTKNMNQGQYDDYCAQRQIGFVIMPITRKSATQLAKFVKYLDSQNRIIKPGGKYLQFLSFVCCRIVRKIMFQIIRARNEGKLQPTSSPITYEQVLKFGNILIQQYQQRFMQAKQSLQTIQQKAKTCFIQDYTNPKFRPLFPKSYSSPSPSLSSSPSSSLHKNAQHIWSQCAHYRELWTERLKGEMEIEKEFREGYIEDQYEPRSAYAKFIMQNYQYYQNKGKASLWEKYFAQEKIGKEEQSQGNGAKPRKRVKLESLKE